MPQLCAPTAANSSTTTNRHHLLISGTGRAGTTFLVQLFNQLGLDTGFADNVTSVCPHGRAGMEQDIHLDQAPYVVKTPFLCEQLDAFLEDANGRVVIDHLFIPVRDLYAAAESRRFVTQQADRTIYPNEVPGGLWKTGQPAQQEQILQSMLYQLIFTAAKWEIPTTLLHFPRTVRDAEYLYRKLEPTLDGMSYERFLVNFRMVAKPELVHEFGRASSNEPDDLPRASSQCRC